MKHLSVVLFVSAILMLSSCSKPLSPQYLGYQNFRMEKLGLNKMILATEAKIYNPNSYPLQLKSASMDVYMNASFLGHTSLDSLVILPAKDTAYIPLRLQASAKDIISNAAKLLLNPNVLIKITGSAKAGRHGIFITIPIDYEGTQRIDLLGGN